MPSFKRKRIPEYQGTGKKFKGAARSSVTALTRKVNKILSEQERKNFDATATIVTAAGVAQIIQLNSIVQGDDAVSRDGRKIAMVSSQMRYSWNGTAANPVRRTRIIVLVDKQSNGVSPVAADILTAPTNVHSPLTLDFKERFRVVHDNFCTLGKGDLDLGLDTTILPGSYFYKYPSEMAQVEYGGIGNIPTSGALLMLVLTDTTNGLQYYHRARFTDS